MAMACRGGALAFSSSSLHASAGASHQLASRVNFLTSKVVTRSILKKTLSCTGLHVDTSGSMSSSKPMKLDESHDILQDRAQRVFDSYNIQEAESDEEFWAAAWLRAECHCEDQTSARYVESTKKKFAEEEFVAVKRRQLGKYGRSIKSLCFMAIRRESLHNNILQEHHGTLLENVIGTLDITVRQLMRGEAFPGDITRSSLSVGVSALQRPHRYGYIANMCVTKTSRNKGIASSLVQVAIEAGKDWGLKEIYVHVYPSNIAGQRLYIKSGFQMVQTNFNQTKPEDVQLLRLVL